MFWLTWSASFRTTGQCSSTNRLLSIILSGQNVDWIRIILKISRHKKYHFCWGESRREFVLVLFTPSWRSRRSNFTTKHTQDNHKAHEEFIAKFKSGVKLYYTLLAVKSFNHKVLKVWSQRTRRIHREFEIRVKLYRDLLVLFAPSSRSWRLKV